MYSFGTFVMTDSIHNAWLEFKSQTEKTTINNPQMQSPQAANVSGDYTYVGTDYGEIGPAPETSLTGDGVRIDAFVENEDKKVMLTLSSYCDRFDSSSFINGTFVSAYVQDFEIGLEKTSSSCYIVGIEEMNLPEDGENEYLDVAFNTASSLLWLLPPPYNAGANIIMDILANLSRPATFNHSDYTDLQSLQVDGGTWSEMIFDDAALPIVFQIGNSSSTSKTFTGIGYGSLTYVADVYVTVFYIPTRTAEVPITLRDVS